MGNGDCKSLCVRLTGKGWSLYCLSFLFHPDQKQLKRIQGVIKAVLPCSYLTAVLELKYFWTTILFIFFILIKVAQFWKENSSASNNSKMIVIVYKVELYWYALFPAASQKNCSYFFFLISLLCFVAFTEGRICGKINEFWEIQTSPFRCSHLLHSPLKFNR